MFLQSIHERDLLFSKFVSGPTNLYSAADMSSMKEELSSMVKDKWNRKQLQDPSVDHDFARKVIWKSLSFDRSNYCE